MALLQRRQKPAENRDVVNIVGRALDVLVDEGEQLKEEIFSFVGQSQQWTHCIEHTKARLIHLIKYNVIRFPYYSQQSPRNCPPIISLQAYTHL
jgi:tRNA A37 methylthiotransferase MiaB